MNCDKWKMKILLAETGELSSREEAELRDHIESCDECSSYLKDSEAIVSAAGKALPNPSISPAVMANIRSRAKDRIRPKTLLFSTRHTQLLAYAAALALIFGGWFFMSGNNHDLRANTFSAIISATTVNDKNEEEVISENTILSELAEQLLQMEGFYAEDSFIDLEFSELEPQTTDLQSHNIPEHPEEKCV